MTQSQKLRCLIALGWTFAGGKGGGTTGTTADVPKELRNLIMTSVGALPGQTLNYEDPWSSGKLSLSGGEGGLGIVGMMPEANEWFNAFSNSVRNQPGASAVQIAPLTPMEQQLQGLGQTGMSDYLSKADPGWWQSFRAMNLDSPLTKLAGTLSPTPQMTNYLQSIAGQGFDALRTPLPQGPAGREFYNNLLNAEDLLGQRGGTLSQEAAANSALNSMSGVAGQRIDTPQAEIDALAQIAHLTSGNIGSSPATQQAIAALEQQYNTRALPALQNQLAQAGLGRSGALEQGIADLRGQLFGAEVPLLQQEISNREQTLPVLQNIANAQTGRQTGQTDRLLQALSTQASGLTSLGGQLGSRSSSDIQRDLSSRLAASSQLQAQQPIESAAQSAPIERMISYIQSQFQPGVAMAAQESARLDKPIDRQIETALQASNAFGGINTQQMDFAKLLSQIGAQPRLLQQAENEATVADNLRQQALAESVIFGPLGIMPSMIGSTTKTSGGGK